MSRLKPWVKIALIVLVVGGLSIFLFTSNSKGDDSKSESKSKGISSLFKNDGDVLNVGVNTYAGFLQLIWLNNGLEPNEDSPIFKDYGLKLNISIYDDFTAGRAAFKNGDLDMIYCTTDVLSTEMGQSSDMIDSRMFVMLDKSRGSDVIVVNKNIKTVADLKGKRIAYAEGTVSHTLLLNVLETNGISGTEIEHMKVGSGIDAAEAFKSGNVDACVTWSPLDLDCVGAVPGSRSIISTKQASEISADGLLAKSDFIEKNKEKLTKFVSAVLYGNYMVSNDKTALATGSEIFAKSFEGFKPQDVVDGSKNIRYATLGDQINYFGLNPSFNGITAEQIYSKMARVYEGLGLTKSPIPWRKVSDTSIIESLMEKPEDVKGVQEAEGDVKFTAPTKELETVSPISNKTITIQFENNSIVLDNNARSLIDREFGVLAKQFRGSRVRVEGNTDAVGDPTYNKNLSLKRAQAVVDYLVTEYGFDPNRFVVVGNGPKNAIRDGIKGSNPVYRVTNFQLLSE